MAQMGSLTEHSPQDPQDPLDPQFTDTHYFPKVIDV